MSSNQNEYEEMYNWLSVLPVLSARSCNQVIGRVATRQQELREAELDLQNSKRLEKIENNLKNQLGKQKERLEKRVASHAENLENALITRINRKRIQFNRELFQIHLKRGNLLIDDDEKRLLSNRQMRKQGAVKTTRGLTSQQYRDFFIQLRAKPKAEKPGLLKVIEKVEFNKPISLSRVVNYGNQYELLLNRVICGRAVQKTETAEEMFNSELGKNKEGGKENSMRHAVPKKGENVRELPSKSFQRFQNRQTEQSVPVASVNHTRMIRRR